MGPARMLDESLLVSVAGDTVFGRGVGYVRYLRGLRVMGSTATGTIQARNVYPVELDWTDDRLAGHCTCPHHADGHFCKHLVALGLAVIDGQQPATRAVAAAVDAIDDVVASLPRDDLRVLVADLARRDDRLRRELELRHAASSGDDHRLADELVGLVRGALSVRGFIDYRRSFEVAADLERVLDELGRILDLGQPDAARPAALKALTRMQAVIGQADDSAGVLGDACQRAADLYARACREGSPDRSKLARWLVRFRRESPGWPELELADFVDAFDEAALQAYRREVETLDATQAGGDHRYEVDAMLLELADLDGDLDRAIELLVSGTPRYGAIVRRLWQAGRAADALVWLDQAAEAGRLSARGGANDYWLEPLEVATAYRDAGRVDDALDVLRGAFARQPGAGTFRQLVDFAAAVERGDDTRQWALAAARQQAAAPYADGAALVEIALAEDDVDAAWEAAESYGAGRQWERLAAASATARPLDAARLYRQQVDHDLAAGADTRRYPTIARRLAMVRDLETRGGRPDEFAAYLSAIRDDYRRRPSLMAAIDRAGL